MTDTWLDRLCAGNAAFRAGADPARLPVARSPGRYALVTCMDPRVNPAALGLEPFAPDGACDSQVRLIRTIGAMAEERSLIVAIHLAGVREIAVVMHSDCGNCLAKQKIDVMAGNLARSLDPADYESFRQRIGEPFAERLVAHLMAFDDPRKAVRQEVARIHAMPFVPRDLVLHGLVYDLASASLDVVVDGRPAGSG